jgi:hypothetical protein
VRSQRHALAAFYPRERPGIVRSKRGGTSLREKAGFKGKQANGVGTQLMKRDRQITACTALLPCYKSDVYTSPASAWLNWHPRLFEWTDPYLWKTKSSLCAFAITFQTHSTYCTGSWASLYVHLLFPPCVLYARHMIIIQYSDYFVLWADKQAYWTHGTWTPRIP